MTDDLYVSFFWTTSNNNPDVIPPDTGTAGWRKASAYITIASESESVKNNQSSVTLDRHNSHWQECVQDPQVKVS